MFYFPLKSKMDAKSGEIWNFSPLHRILLYCPAGQKFTRIALPLMAFEIFARNRSILYGFRDIHPFSFSAKIQDGSQSGKNWNFSPLHWTLLYYLLWFSRYLLETPLSLTVFEIFTLFYFPLKSKMAAKVAKIEIFPLLTGYSCTTLWVKNPLKIPLSFTVFKIFTIFHFPLKSKMAGKSGENWNFSPSHRIYSCTTLRVKNSLEIALSLIVFMIFTLFHFGRQKWWKLKFFP